MEVSIFDNINTGFQSIVNVTREIAHGFTQLPRFINQSFDIIDQLDSNIPDVFFYMIVLTACAGVVLKITHYGE